MLFRSFPVTIFSRGSNYKGSAWSKGLTSETNDSIKKASQKQKYADKDVFVLNGPIIKSARLRQGLLDNGIKYECSECKIDEWRNKKIRLHVDHKNGNPYDNRIKVNLFLVLTFVVAVVLFCFHNVSLK